jgi:ABC-type transporter Mla subunit MlaD
MRPTLPLALALAGLVATLPCRPVGPDLRVTWQETVDIEVGAAVRYRGVAIGEVISISLLQTSADAPAAVELGLRIDPQVSLRRRDTFEIASDGLLGDAYVAVSPAREPSEPLPPGARVAGTPPIATRVRESADAVIESLGELAREKTDALIEAWALQEEETAERPLPGARKLRPGVPE